MTAPPLHAELREPLERVLAWLLAQRDREGRILCPEHRVEHTGKSACVAITAAELARRGGGGELLEAARQQGRRLVANLVREGTSPCHTFRPGRHDPFNCSNNVIDGGAASDALAHLVTYLGSELAADEREAFRRASLLHARTYLRYAVLDKGVPAQRAWGLTGLAGAAALAADEGAPDGELERALVEAVGMLEGIQNADGSYPYHPLEWDAEHPGEGDVSCFYQSRVTGFLLHALERAGRDPRDATFRDPLLRGLDFLAVLVGPDGIKPGLLEAKPWYWGAPYEVASHPFDVFALARGWRRFGATRYGRAAADAYRAWARHLGSDGRVRSHLPAAGHAASYQCPVFWGAHACWIARCADDLGACLDLEAPPAGGKGGVTLSVMWLPDAALGRLEDDRVVAWVRGARPPYNVHHGSPHGAGLLRVVRREDGAELLGRRPLAADNPGEWSGSSGGFAPRRGLAAGGRELRFSLWRARVHHRAGRSREALASPWHIARRGILAFAGAEVSSGFDRAPRVSVLADGFELGVRLCHRGGEAARGSDLLRAFRVDGAGLTVSEHLVAPGAVRGAEYHLPAGASEVRREDGGERISYRLS